MNFDTFPSVFHRLLKEKKAFAAFRFPDDGYLYFLKENRLSDIDFIAHPQEGFVFAPFSPTQKRLFLQGKFERIPLPELIWKPSRNRKDNIQHFYQPDDATMSAYIDKVEEIKNYLNEGECAKIVLSREEMVSLNKSVPEEIFKSLLAAYPNAFVMAFYHPDTELWLAATPENLLSVRDEKLRTVSLAGTKQFLKDQVISWREKEKKEQQIVTDFIYEILQKHTTEIEIEGPSTVKAGRLLHLHTQLTAKFERKYLPAILDQLHPTPATCGFPKEKALNYLHQNEGYDRAYYTGYAGPVFDNGHMDFYVTLRCMQYKEKLARIFVGGGITTDSLGEEEWKETMAKAETMKRILFRLENS